MHLPLWLVWHSVGNHVAFDFSHVVVLEQSVQSMASQCVTQGAFVQDENRDGGYLSTARMILECGLCMIPDNEPLLKEDPYASKCPAGVCASGFSFLACSPAPVMGNEACAWAQILHTKRV